MTTGMKPISFAACRSAGLSLPTMSAFAPKLSSSSCVSGCGAGADAAAAISRLRRSTGSFVSQTGHGINTGFIGSLVSSIESTFWQDVQVIFIALLQHRQHRVAVARLGARLRLLVRQAQAEVGGIRGVGERDLFRDHALLPQLLQFVVEYLHPIDGTVVHGVDQRAPLGFALEHVVASAH